MEELPSKRRCISKNEEKIGNEQEFQSPQQFPNMIKQSVNNIIIDTKDERCRINIGNSPNSVLGIPEIPKIFMEQKIPYKLRRLRILTPDGRDLGEFNLEWRIDNLSKKQKIVISKLHNFKSAEKQIQTVSSSTLSRISSLAFKQAIMKRAKCNLINKTLCNSIAETNKIKILQQQEQQQQQQKQKQYILPICEMQNQAIGANKQQCNNNINKVSISIDPNPKNPKNSKYQIIDNANKNLAYNVMKNAENDLKCQETRNENNKHFSGTNVKINGKNKSLFPAINCKNFSKCDNSDFLKMCTIYSKGKCIATIKNTENGKIVTALTAINFARNCNQIDKNHKANCLDSNNKSINYQKVTEIPDNRNKVLLDKSNLLSKNNQVRDMKLQKNIMTVIPNNKNGLPKLDIALTRKYDITVPSISDKNINNIQHNEVSCSIIYDNIQSEDVLKKTYENDNTYLQDTSCNQISVQCIPDLQRTADIGTNVQLNVQNNKDLHPNDLVNRYNIIKKAMDSVKDNELRRLAIQALADCGIGIERYIPIHLPHEYKTVHDTQVQTMIFGLLDPTSFMSVDKDTENILRINHTTLHQMYNNNHNLVKLPNNVQSYNNSTSNVIEEESNFDIDSFINQICEENSILKMKDTLSMTDRCMRIVEKLEKDFKGTKRYDQNGRLSIHNAVLSNNIYLVQRQLIVLKLCKENIDVLTQNGEVDFFI